MNIHRKLVSIRNIATRTGLYNKHLNLLSPSNYLIDRHIGPDEPARKAMLDTIGVASLDELVDKTLPPGLPANPLPDWPALTDESILSQLASLASQNQVVKNYMGWGYYGTFVPPVILRNLMQNPGWYTSYTPYQAEISQGRLQALLIFQTMISSLTQLPVANASLLDEATAAAEAMTMTYIIHNRKKSHFLVSDKAFPSSIAVIQTRAEPMGITIHVGDVENFDLKKYPLCGVLVQSPDKQGEIKDFTEFSAKVKEAGASLVMGSDLLSLCVTKSPGEMGADVSYGNSQRFGVPMGYGGPHAAFFASKSEFIRKMPGRIIGVSKDRNGDHAYRMTMQTREQHIRREKATSNICTAQALLSNMAGMYALYHGPENLQKIAGRVNALAALFKQNLQAMDYKVITQNFFDTIAIQVANAGQVITTFESYGINLRKQSDSVISVSFDETSTTEGLTELVEIFGKIKNKKPTIDLQPPSDPIPEFLHRKSSILKHKIFSQVPSESQMLRYLYRLQRKDISLANSMIPLGSCTMKLNATIQMIPVTNPGFGQIHPHAPLSQTKGYHSLISQLGQKLKTITGFDQISFQSNSGAQGEYSGMVTIRNFHKNNGENRDVALIPVSAHGTNPATCSMLGMDVVTINCEKSGNISVQDFKAKAEQYKDRLAGTMITYPSTFGVFDNIGEVIDIVHHYGGQVYMDGANMNAQVGLTSPGAIGADVCHLNLHKTFAIPHGGGGPGMGPIGVKKHLAPFLPKDIVIDEGGSGGMLSSFHYGSASILPISWAYIKALGSIGCTESTRHAILNANYIRKRLEPYYNIVFVGEQGMVAHELIIDLRPFKATADVSEDDVAKRLMDYGFHSPTMSFPIPGTLMIEPTESEDKQELDRFCDSLIGIRQEIHEIESGEVDRTNNVLRNAPHSLKDIVNSSWNRPYTKEKGAFPLPWIHIRGKFWPVSRIDNVWGDKHPATTLPDVDYHF